MSLSAAQRRDLARVMWSGGLAVAMTGSVLVAGALLPTAVADHGTDPLLVEGNLRFCSELEVLNPEHGPFNPTEAEDAGGDHLTEGVHLFDEVAVEVIYDGGEPQFLDVVPEPGFEITAVIVKGGPDAHVYYDGPFTGMHSPDNEGGNQAAISHYTVCVGDEKTPPPTSPPETTPPPEEEVDAGGICVGSVPYMDYAIDDDLFDTPVPDGGLTITFEHPTDPLQNHVVTGLDGTGQVLWPGAEVDEEGNGTDWPGWIFEDGSWVQADDGFEWVRPSVMVTFEWNPEITTEVEYPEAGGECNPPPSEDEEDIQLSILDPICDDDVPYLEYLVEPEGFEATDVTITWINPDGEDVVYEDLPLSGRVLWAGAVTGPDGEPLDWPGWIQLDDGSWIEGDDGFQWVRPSVDVLFQVNPEQTLTVGYPPSSPDCAAQPPGTLPKTGAKLTIGFAGGGLLLGGLVLMLIGRRRLRNQS